MKMFLNIKQIFVNNTTVSYDEPFQEFEIPSVGEGVVWKCCNAGYEGSKFWYKNKGSEHSGSKVVKLANINVEKLSSIKEFVEKVVDEERLQQGYNYLVENNLFDYEKSMGSFLSWVFNDIIKEESDTLAASGLTKKDVSGEVARVAKRWYLDKLKTV